MLTTKQTQRWMIKMRVLKVMDTLKLCVVDLEVELNGSLRHAPTLCAMDGQYVIPLNTPDGRPILMDFKNAIKLA